MNEDDYVVNALDFYVGGDSGAGCVIVVNVGTDSWRKRLALTGRYGVDDFDIHEVILELFFDHPDNDVEAAQLAYDLIPDQLAPLIRANPLLSAPNEVWSAGEYRAGVRRRQGAPFTRNDGTGTFIFGKVTFESWQNIVGPVGI